MRSSDPVPTSKRNLSPFPSSSSQHDAACFGRAVGIPCRRRSTASRLVRAPRCWEHRKRDRAVQSAISQASDCPEQRRRGPDPGGFQPAPANAPTCIRLLRLRASRFRVVLSVALLPPFDLVEGRRRYQKPRYGRSLGHDRARLLSLFSKTPDGNIVWVRGGHSTYTRGPFFALRASSKGSVKGL